MLTFEQCAASRKTVMPRRSTYLVLLDRDTFAIRYHNTDVVCIHRDGTYTLTSGGWRTVTTKQRINEYSPGNVHQHDFEWYINGYIFFDGIRVDGKGTVLNADEDLKVAGAAS